MRGFYCWNDLRYMQLSTLIFAHRCGGDVAGRACQDGSGTRDRVRGWHGTIHCVRVLHKNVETVHDQWNVAVYSCRTLLGVISSILLPGFQNELKNFKGFF